MAENQSNFVQLGPRELQALYAMSNAVAREPDLEKALANIVRLTRPVLIFDNLVVYSKTDSSFEAIFARSIGRGRSAEAEISWGESLAAEVMNTCKRQILQEKLENWESNRLNQHDMLGLPIQMADELLGVMVMGRFGGPEFSPSQVQLAELVVAYVTHLLSRDRLIRRIADLEAARRLQELQENFIATVSHELKSPLGFIKGYTTTLLRKDISWDEKSQREFLTIIDEETDGLRSLIDNLLDSSRLQSGTMRMQMQLVQIDDLLHEIVGRTRRRYPHLQIGLDLRARFTLMADPIRLTQVIDNLVTNAVKYADGSPIWFSVDILSQSPLGGGLTGRVIVRDRGPGIPPEYLDKIFNRFYRVPGANSQTHGTGLGLYICKEIVQAHHGEIQCESRLGQGTSFHIYLPIITQTSTTPSAGEGMQ